MTLQAWTAGLVGPRDPAQPLLTLLDGPARVELSGATTANWVAKSANLLVDGLGSPARVGLLLPLHWQAVALLLAGTATGATVVLVGDPDGLTGCDVAFTTPEAAEGALDAGVDDVLVLSGHPLGAPVPGLTGLATDYAREVPTYADHWGGPAAGPARLEVEGAELGPVPALPLTAADRVLLAAPLVERAGLRALLGVLGAGAAALLLPDPASLDLDRVAQVEGATATAGLSVAGLPRLD